jgi:hypothetical protein
VKPDAAAARVSDAYRASAFGLVWQADLPMTRFRTCESPALAPDVRISRVGALPPRAGGVEINRGWIYADGIRLVWEEEVGFDLRGSERIDYAPGPAWSGALPDAFYSTVAALTLAWRGLLPFHASTVAIDGRAVLIAGPAGTGKSTLAAALTGQGARWLADDLSAVSRDAAGRFHAHPGRIVARLHAPVCTWIGAIEHRPANADPRGKRLVGLADVADVEATELAGILALGMEAGPLAAIRRPEMLTRQMFRPRWLAQLPNAPLRRLQLLALASKLPVIGVPVAEMRDAAAFHAQGEAVLALVRSAL